MQTVQLFVYGTLKRGSRNHQELRGAAFVGEAQTTIGFELRFLGSYPGLTPGVGRVSGELYEVGEELLHSLDLFEGPEFLRAAIELDGGQRAQVYMLRDPRVAPRVISDGVWRDPI